MDRNVEGAIEIAADRATLFDHLTDYPRLAEWLPGVESTRVLAREGDVVIVELTAPGLSAPSLVLELVHSPPNLVHFTRVDRYRGEGTTGTWEIAETDDGSELRASLRPGPSFASSRGRRNLKAGVDRALEAIRRGIEQMPSEPRAEDEPDGRRKILEVTRRGDTVEVWYRGKVFELPRRAEDG
jgi:uncharacterized protein YndB with AHSA1/START domain